MSYSIRRRCPRCYQTYDNVVLWIGTAKQSAVCSNCGHQWHCRLKRDEQEEIQADNRGRMAPEREHQEMMIERYKYGFGRPPEGEYKGTVEATPHLIEVIAHYNGKLSAKKVREMLEAGQRVYTAFSFYQKAK